MINTDFVIAPFHGTENEVGGGGKRRRGRGRRALENGGEKETTFLADAAALAATHHAAGHVRWISDSGAFEVSRVDPAVKCFTVVADEGGREIGSGRADAFSEEKCENRVRRTLCSV